MYIYTCFRLLHIKSPTRQFVLLAHSRPSKPIIPTASSAAAATCCSSTGKKRSIDNRQQAVGCTYVYTYIYIYIYVNTHINDMNNCYEHINICVYICVYICILTNCASLCLPHYI